MLLLDVLIIIFLALGTLLGFKRGAIKGAVTFFGTILVLILAWQLKNPISSFMWNNLPFFKLGGIFKGIEGINILLYEGIAFLVVFALLYFILKLVIKLTGLLETILKMTVILAIPSKIIGAILGFCEYYIYIFVVLFFLSGLSFSIEGLEMQESDLASFILNNTPVLSGMVSEGHQSINEIYALKDKYEESETKQFNDEVLSILIKYNVISKENVLKLEEKGKITITDRSVLEEKND